MKQTINTESVLLLKSKSSSNHYFRHDGGIVLVPENIAQRWDDIDSVDIDEVKYSKRTDENGNLIDEDWSRMEVVGIKDTNLTLSKKTKRLNAATAYAKAKNESLKMEDLAPSVKSELETLLAF